MSKCKYGMQKPVQNVLQQCINGFKRMEKGGIGVANECVQQACEMALKYINELEAKLAYSKPVKRGHWILTERTKLVMTGKVGIKESFSTATKDNVDKATFILKRHITITRPKCSVCGYWGYDDSDITLYCPNCGAKMDGGDENAN